MCFSCASPAKLICHNPNSSVVEWRVDKILVFRVAFDESQYKWAEWYNLQVVFACIIESETGQLASNSESFQFGRDVCMGVNDPVARAGIINFCQVAINICFDPVLLGVITDH